MDVVRRIAHSEGPRGFFRGLPPTLVGILPSRSVYFWAYGTTKAALGPVSPSTDLTHMGAAVVAGMTANTITNPVWLLKTRMQLQAGALSAAAEGTAAGAVTEGALHFLLYERLKRAAVARNYARAEREAEAVAAAGDGRAEDEEDDDDDDDDPLTNPAYAPSSMQLVSSAAIAKLVASMVTYPHETVRTRMREQPPIPGVRSRYHAMFPSLRLIAMEEGRRGLYAGMGTHLLRVVPSTAIMFLTFETAVRWLERQQQKRQQQQ